MSTPASTALFVRIVQGGVGPDDHEEERLRKSALTFVAILVTLLTPIWVGAYLVAGRPLSAALPGMYSVWSIITLAYMFRTKRPEPFIGGQILAFLALPVLLQWTLGGFERGSAVAIWAFAAPLGALVSYGRRVAVRWFVAFGVLIAASGLAEPWLRNIVQPLTPLVQIAFWVLNVTAPLATAFALLLYFTRQREIFAARSEELLLNILPASVAERLKDGGDQIADRHENASVLFADIVDFTAFSDRTSPERLVALLSRVFSTLDALADGHGLERIKTLGDGYLAAAGVTDPAEDHALRAAAMALAVGPALRDELAADWPGLQVRIGIASGPVVAGVIGRRRFSYDLWGDTVNTASRMATTAEPGMVQVTEATAQHLAGRAQLRPREPLMVKGKGEMRTYRLAGLDPQPSG